MHPQVREWVQEAVDIVGEGPARVIEIGSRHLQPRGSRDDPRSLVPGVGQYVGIDAHPGPGVDVVTTCADYEPDGPADLVLLLQTLEHDPRWALTVSRAWSWVAPGGVLCITCAGEGCPEHDLGDSPVPGHYRNVTSLDVLGAIGLPLPRVRVSDVEAVMKKQGGPVPWTRTRVLAIRE